MNVKILAAAIATLTLTAQAEKYDYEVEYVKSTRESVVKTELVPETGTVFKIDVKFDGEPIQQYSGQFDNKRHTIVFFGQEDYPSEDGFKGRFNADFTLHDGKYVFGAHFDPNNCSKAYTDAVLGRPVQITYDGMVSGCGPFTINFDDRRYAAWKTPIAFFGMALRDGSVRSYASFDMEFYGAVFHRDGKCVADFIPVVRGGVAGIYDKVGKKFFASVTSTPLVAGPKKTKKVEKTGGGGERRKGDYEVPIFDEDFSNDKVFAERWELVGNQETQVRIVMKDGAVRMPGYIHTGDGIQWKGELPDDFAVEAEIAVYPEWCGMEAPKYDGHWAVINGDYGTFGIKSSGDGCCHYPPPSGKGMLGAYPAIPGFQPGVPVTVRYERRRVGANMMAYTYIVNGVRYNDYMMPVPKKRVGFDGKEHWKPLSITGFQCPFECRRVTVYELRNNASANLISNSGFEYDSDGVPYHYCNRSAINWTAVSDYTDTYQNSFVVDRKEKHSGKQSLRITVGPHYHVCQFFPWSAQTVPGRSAVLSIWAKASEPDVPLRLRLDPTNLVVKLTTDWKRYELPVAKLPDPQFFGPIHIYLPDTRQRTTNATVWLDDLQYELIEMPEGGFVPGKTYATEYHPKNGDDERFALGKPVPHDKPTRKEPLTPAENALCGYTAPTNGLVIGHYDFYMNEPTADFRVWDGQGGFEQVSLDLAKLPCGTNAVTVKALGRDWPAEVVKLPFVKGATQINQWSRTLVHDGKPLFFCAHAIIARENWPKEDGSSTQVDALADAGFRHILVQNNCCTRDIDSSRMITRHASKRGMKSFIWCDQGDLREEDVIMDWYGKMVGKSRKWMYDQLDTEDVVAVIPIDEPEGRSEKKVQDFMKIQKSYFPYKPVLMNNSWFGIAGRFAGLPTDVLMIDFYLTNPGTTLEMVVSKIDVMRGIAPGKPCWYWMESENSLHPYIPSYKEQLTQCWGAVAAGAGGIAWFINMPHTRTCYESTRDFNREIADNEAFLCSDELCGGAIASETEHYIRCLTRKVGDEWRIYTVNVNPHPNAKVAFRLPPEIPQDAKLEVMYENRTVQAKGGLFGDAFDGYSRHIYRVKK